MRSTSERTGVKKPAAATPSGAKGARRGKAPRPKARGLKPPAAEALTAAEVRHKLGLSQIEMSRITGYSLRSVAGWETGKPLSGPARQKFIETDRLRAALSQLLPPGQVGEWLRSPNPAFEGQTPIQVIERGESDRLWRMIIQIDSAVAS